MENVAVSFANRPEAIFAVVAAGVLPDQNRSGENSGGIVETDAAFAQRPGVLCLVPLEFHCGQYAFSVVQAMLNTRWGCAGID